MKRKPAWLRRWRLPPRGLTAHSASTSVTNMPASDDDIPPVPELDVHEAMEELQGRSLPMDPAEGVCLMTERLAELQRDGDASTNPDHLRFVNQRIKETKLRLAHYQAQFDGRN